MSKIFEQVKKVSNLQTSYGQQAFLILVQRALKLTDYKRSTDSQQDIINHLYNQSSQRRSC